MGADELLSKESSARAYAALADYADDEETNVFYLLTDLMHLCRQRGYGFDKLLEEARAEFKKEAEAV